MSGRRDGVIQLACSTSAEYVRHTGAMLHSVLDCTPFGGVSVNLLHLSPLEEVEQRQIQKVTDSYGAALDNLYVDEGAIAGMPTGYFAPAVWLKVFLPELMLTADKVLYLDSDMIVTDDLRTLWETELGSHLLAAVTNPLYPFMRQHPREDLGIQDPQDYFNSGVLLMNLDLMRREGMLEKLLGWARTHPEIGAPDQDALNVVCKDRWLKLHPRWNVQSTMFEMKARQLPILDTQLKEALESPAVIHFIGPSKPWHRLSAHPLRELYMEHARATPWGEPPIEGRTVRNSILRRLPVAWTYRHGAVEKELRAVWRRVISVARRARSRVRKRLKRTA